MRHLDPITVKPPSPCTPKAPKIRIKLKPEVRLWQYSGVTLLAAGTICSALCRNQDTAGGADFSWIRISEALGLRGLGWLRA